MKLLVLLLLFVLPVAYAEDLSKGKVIEQVVSNDTIMTTIQMPDGSLIVANEQNGKTTVETFTTEKVSKSEPSDISTTVLIGMVSAAQTELRDINLSISAKNTQASIVQGKINAATNQVNIDTLTSVMNSILNQIDSLQGKAKKLKENMDEWEKELKNRGVKPLPKPKDQTNANIPLMFGDIMSEPRWPDQCVLWNTEHSPNRDKLWMLETDVNTINCMSNQFKSGNMIYIDHDENNRISNCNEMLCNFDWPFTLMAYDVLNNSQFDSNHNGLIDNHDWIWNDVKVWDFKDDSSHSLEELGIIAISLSYQRADDDHRGPGMYADCRYDIGEQIDYLYRNWVDAGGKCTPISDSHVRYKAYSEAGVTYKDGSTERSFDVVIGYWNDWKVSEIRQDLKSKQFFIKP